MDGKDILSNDPFLRKNDDVTQITSKINRLVKITRFYGATEICSATELN